jgi:CRP/FNR family transcriptional regulator
MNDKARVGDTLPLLASFYPSLAELPPAAREALAHARVIDIPAHTRVFDEHQPCQGFPFVLEGGIRVVKCAPSGRELPLYRVTPGESCIITSACLLGHVDYNARGETESATRLALLPSADFLALLAHEPFRRFVFHLFAERLADLMQLVEEVAFKKLDQRLAALLLGRGQVVHATHQQLADELGSVREIVSRLLKNFAAQGLVRLGREQIEILDAAGLRTVAA